MISWKYLEYVSCYIIMIVVLCIHAVCPSIGSVLTYKVTNSTAVRGYTIY